MIIPERYEGSQGYKKVMKLINDMGYKTLEEFYINNQSAMETLADYLNKEKKLLNK